MLAEELRRLREAASRPERERRRYLADLASRLRVLNLLHGGNDELSALAAELERAERADADVNALWQRAVGVLEHLTSDTPRPDTDTGPDTDTDTNTQSSTGVDIGTGAGNPPSERRPFWKRS
jgi:Ca-activated chloride channel family protein